MPIVFLLEFFDNVTNYAYSGVKPTALTAECSDRLTALAKPKPTPKGYIEAYLLPKSVSEQALNNHISDRIAELAKPRQNTIILNAAWKNSQK